MTETTVSITADIDAECPNQGNPPNGMFSFVAAPDQAIQEISVNYILTFNDELHSPFGYVHVDLPSEDNGYALPVIHIIAHDAKGSIRFPMDRKLAAELKAVSELVLRDIYEVE